MKFNADKFDRHLNNMGQRYLWRRSYACSCVNPSSGAPDTKCPVCSGKGVYWIAPVPASAATSGQKTQIQWANMGRYEGGDIVLTVPQNSPIWDAGDNDRVTMLNATDRFSQPLKRGAPTEGFLFHVAAIERVFWLHPTTKAIVEGGIPVVAENGTLTWTAGEPPAGMSYSITGTKHSEYYLYQELPRNRNMHNGMRLPKMVVLRRFDLFGR